MYIAYIADRERGLPRLHLRPPPLRTPTTSVVQRLGCNISRRGRVGGGKATRPPLTYPRPDKPFSEPIPPRPCTPSAPALQEASNRSDSGVALKNGAGSSYFRSRHSPPRPSDILRPPLMSLKFRFTGVPTRLMRHATISQLDILLYL